MDGLQRLERARWSLDGLSVGDAFGERFFCSPAILETLIESRAVPAGPWRWTDDTAMALSVVEVLERHGGIEPGALANAFTRRYVGDPARGYGRGAHEILSAISQGTDWREAAASAFGGEGSMGNGAAMRSAPIGAYFGDRLDDVAEHARRSAEPTHAHPDGAAGAIAVAMAAALISRIRGVELLEAVAERTPAGPTRDGLVRAASMSPTLGPRVVAEKLGSGALVLSLDTVPFSIYAAAHHGDDFEEALWFTVAGLGDRDTTCAIVGGIVSLSAPSIPSAFLLAREALR